MLNLQYVGDTTKYPVNFRRISDHVVQVTGKIPVKLSGFTLSRLVPDNWRPDYSRYNTVYREINGGVQFSDDGSVYVAPPEPEPLPDPESSHVSHPVSSYTHRGNVSHTVLLTF